MATATHDLAAIVRGAVKQAAPSMLVSERANLVSCLQDRLEQHPRRQSGAGRRRRRRRRPSVDAAAWSALLELINNARKRSVTTLETVQPFCLIPRVPSSDIVPRSLPAFDAACHRLLAWWAEDPRQPLQVLDTNSELPALALERTLLVGLAGVHDGSVSPVSRFMLWVFLLMGTLEAYRGEATKVASWADVSAWGSPGVDPADEFLSWWWRPRALAMFEEPERRFVEITMALFRRQITVRRRIRRCQYLSCAQFFLDQSPTYRRIPARGCTRSHTTMAERKAKTPVEPLA